MAARQAKDHPATDYVPEGDSPVRQKLPTQPAALMPHAPSRMFYSLKTTLCSLKNSIVFNVHIQVRS